MSNDDNEIKMSFNPDLPIEDPNHLFGRKDSELQEIIDSLKSGANPELIGEKSSGKTSVLKCLENSILNGKAGKNKIPVYIDSLEYPEISGKNQTYQLINSYILARFIDYKKLWSKDKTMTIRDLSMNKEKDQNSFFLLLKNLSIQNQEFFTDLIFKADSEGFQVIILLDEYERMFIQKFNNEKGSFYPIRELVENRNQALERNLKCVIAGARSYKMHEERSASDDFSYINDPIYLKPLQSADRCREIFDASFKIYKNDPDAEWKGPIREVFELSGGWRHLVILIANDVVKVGSLATESIFFRTISYFEDIWNRLENKYKLVLIGESNNLLDIAIAKKLSLIKQTEDRITPNGSLFRLYLAKKISFNVRKALLANRPESIDLSETFSLVQELHKITSEINETMDNKNWELIFNFQRSYKYGEYALNLVVPCRSEGEFFYFITSIYFIAFEATQGQVFNHREQKFFFRNKKALPQEFNKGKHKGRSFNNLHDIYYYIDVLRHRYAWAHDTANELFLPENYGLGETLEHFLGSRNNPSDMEWHKIQILILKEFIDFLTNLVVYARNQSVNIEKNKHDAEPVEEDTSEDKKLDSEPIEDEESDSKVEKPPEKSHTVKNTKDDKPDKPDSEPYQKTNKSKDTSTTDIDSKDNDKEW